MKSVWIDLIEKVDFSIDKVKEIKPKMKLVCEECGGDYHSFHNVKNIFTCDVCVMVKENQERSKGMF